MTTEKKIELLAALIREHGNAEKTIEEAEKAIKAPQRYAESAGAIPFYGTAAALLAALAEEVEAKSSGKTVLSAVKRFFSNPQTRPQFSGIFECGGRYCAVDGYKAIRLVNDLPGLGHVENDFDIDRAFEKPIENAIEEMALPTVAELKTWIASNGGKRAAREKPYLLNGCVLVNAEYLIAVIQALPGCVAYIPDGPTAAIYFKAEAGDAILLPVRARGENEKVIAEFWQPRREKAAKEARARIEAEKAAEEAAEAAEAKAEADAAPVAPAEEKPAEAPEEAPAFNVGDYVCTLEKGVSLYGKITGKHGSADYYSVEYQEDGQRKTLYRYGRDLIHDPGDAAFVEAVNANTIDRARLAVLLDYFGYTNFEEAQSGCGLRGIDCYRLLEEAYTDDNAPLADGQKAPEEAPKEEAAEEPEAVEKTAPAPEAPEAEEEPKTAPADAGRAYKIGDPLDDLRPGDIVKVSGTGFKTASGIFAIYAKGQSRSGAGRLSLLRLKKNGELTQNNNIEYWPPVHYCSDSRKNRGAARIDKESAVLQLAPEVSTEGTYKYFLRLVENQKAVAANYTEKGMTADAAEAEENAAMYQAIADRIKPAILPEEKEPEKGIRFYYNGIKVDGGKLKPCYFWINDDGSVTICAKYVRLPREYFEVVNNSDPYSDYYDDDKTTLTPENPLYKYVYYVALKGICTGKTYKKATEAQKAAFASMENPGQPCAADYDAIRAYREAKQAEKEKAQAEAAAKARKELEEAKATGEEYIKSVSAKYPITDGAPVVTVLWSESPAFYSWGDGELKLSISAADIIFEHLDTERAQKNKDENRGGYDKTKYQIEYTDPENGNIETFVDRYDLGDGNGGIIKLMRAYGNNDFADYLERFTGRGKIVSATVAPWMAEAVKARQEAAERAEEESREAWQNMLEMVEMLTDDQIEEIILSISPADREKADVARFFLQLLARRDEKKAVEIFRKWKGAAG